MTDMDAKEIMRRLKELEEENSLLKSAANDKGPRPLRVTEGNYKGHPILTFEGPCRPFSLGLTKLSIIKRAWPQVTAFLSCHAKKIKIEKFCDDDKI